MSFPRVPQQESPLIYSSTWVDGRFNISVEIHMKFMRRSSKLARVDPSPPQVDFEVDQSRFKSTGKFVLIDNNRIERLFPLVIAESDLKVGESRSKSTSKSVGVD